MVGLNLPSSEHRDTHELWRECRGESSDRRAGKRRGNGAEAEVEIGGVEPLSMLSRSRHDANADLKRSVGALHP